MCPTFFFLTLQSPPPTKLDLAFLSFFSLNMCPALPLLSPCSLLTHRAIKRSLSLWLVVTFVNIVCLWRPRYNLLTPLQAVSGASLAAARSFKASNAELCKECRPCNSLLHISLYILATTKLQACNCINKTRYELMHISNDYINTHKYNTISQNIMKIITVQQHKSFGGVPGIDAMLDACVSVDGVLCLGVKLRLKRKLAHRMDIVSLTASLINR